MKPYMQSYQTYREYFRDVLIAIGLFLVAAEFASWTTPLLRQVFDFSAIYAITFAIGMIPFLLFARHAGAIDFDNFDLLWLFVLSVPWGFLLSLRPQLAAIGIPDFLIPYGAWLVCFGIIIALRRWLASWFNPADAKKS